MSGSKLYPCFQFHAKSLVVTFFSEQEPRQRVAAVKDLIKQLPKPNQDTMQILFRHLKRYESHYKREVVIWKKKNKRTAQLGDLV